MVAATALHAYIVNMQRLKNQSTVWVRGIGLLLFGMLWTHFTRQTRRPLSRGRVDTAGLDSRTVCPLVAVVRPPPSRLVSALSGSLLAVWQRRLRGLCRKLAYCG